MPIKKYIEVFCYIMLEVLVNNIIGGNFYGNSYWN